jgi:hypothetical protein
MQLCGIVRLGFFRTRQFYHYARRRKAGREPAPFCNRRISAITGPANTSSSTPLQNIYERFMRRLGTGVYLGIDALYEARSSDFYQGVDRVKWE